MAITKEKKVSIFTQYGGAASNTGSTEAQVALLTERILDLSKHLQKKQKRLLYSERAYRIGGRT